MATFVTRIVVTQQDDYEPPAWDITAASGFRVWIMEWTKTTNGRADEYRHVEYSIDGARRLTMNLLKKRPPGTEVADVLTLVGFEGLTRPPGDTRPGQHPQE